MTHDGVKVRVAVCDDHELVRAVRNAARYAPSAGVEAGTERGRRER